MNLEDATNLLCAEACLQIHKLVPTIFKGVDVQQGSSEPTKNTTWLVEGSHFFTLAKLNGRTIIYCHKSETMYFAKPDFTLLQNCPEEHAFLCQTCTDKVNEESVNRLLVMDLVYPKFKDPAQRGEILRRISHISFPSTLSLQWMGDPGPLREFTPSLPHKADGIVQLTQDPLVLIREPQDQLRPEDPKRRRLRP